MRSISAWPFVRNSSGVMVADGNAWPDAATRSLAFDRGDNRVRGAAADDLEALCALHNRSEAHDSVPRVSTLEEMREELDDEHIVLATDVRIACATASWPVTRTRRTSRQRCGSNAATCGGQVDPTTAGWVSGGRCSGGGSSARPLSLRGLRQRRAEVHPCQPVRLRRAGPPSVPADGFHPGALLRRAAAPARRAAGSWRGPRRDDRALARRS